MQHSEDRLAAVNSKSDDHGDKNQREDNPVVPIFSTAFWKWLTVTAVSTSSAVLPK